MLAYCWLCYWSPADSNSLYCATLLFAWDEVRKILGSSLSIPEKYRDLRLLNASASFRDMLKPSEYKASGEVQGDYISTSRFYVMLRRTDVQNPYFCLHVVNTELLVKE